MEHIHNNLMKLGGSLTLPSEPPNVIRLSKITLVKYEFTIYFHSNNVMKRQSISIIICFQKNTLHVTDVVHKCS
jgi:hypothetical protein